MKKLSTHRKAHPDNNENKELHVKSSPRKQTLDYLSQFARVYCSKRVLNTKHCGFVLN